MHTLSKHPQHLLEVKIEEQMTTQTPVTCYFTTHRSSANQETGICMFSVFDHSLTTALNDGPLPLQKSLPFVLVYVEYIRFARIGERARLLSQTTSGGDVMGARKYVSSQRD